MTWLAAHKVGIWAFLVAAAFVPGLMSAAIVPRWAVIALGIPLVSQIRWQIPTALQLALLAGVAWSAASILRTLDPADSLLQFFFMLCLLAVMGVGSQLESLDQAISGLCWGLGLSSALCVATLVTGQHFVAYHHPDLIPGLFYNSEVLVEFAAPLVVWAAVKRRWWLVVTSIVPIAANNSRIAVISLIIGLIVGFWPKSTKMRVVTITVGTVALCSAVAWLTMGSFKFGSAASRVTSWLTAVYSFTPAGHGFGWWRATHAGEEFAHSDVLQAFAEIGLAALLFALVPLYALRNRRDHAERAAFIVICIELGLSFPLHVPATGFLAALLAGFLVRTGAGVRGVQHDGGDPAGGRDGRYATGILAVVGGGGRGGGDVPARSAAAVLSSVGLFRGGAA